MFRVQMLPAREGDCLWIEYGEDPNRPHRILIDTGPPGTFQELKSRIEALPVDQRRFELFVITHIDSDHIGAARKLIEERPGAVEFGDVWFNGFRHLLAATDRLGERQAQQFSVALENGEVPWNAAFHNGPILARPDRPLPEIELDGGMKLTVLSPYREQLETLLPRWEDALRDYQQSRPELVDRVAADHLGSKIHIQTLAESPFVADTSAPNGTSIALLAEYGGRRVLFAADAFPGVLEQSIDRLLATGSSARLQLDAYKVSHHGSARNTSPSLARKLAASQYWVSTNGHQHDHPDPEGIARLVYFGAGDARLVFNYQTEFNSFWQNALLRKYRFQSEFPADDQLTGITVDLDP